MAGVIRECFRSVAGLPAADAVLQRLRQVPMVQRGIGLDAVRQELVDQAVIEVEALGIGRAGPIGKYPWPCDRKPIMFDAEIADQADVFPVAMVMLVGAVSGGIALDLARRMRKGVPDRAAAAVLIDGALDLIGRGGGAPPEVLRESRRAVPAGGLLLPGVRRICRACRHSERGKARKLCELPAREFSGHR